MRDSAQIILMVLILTTIVACAPTSWRPNLATIYNDLVQREDLDRNPIIVIPGVMGSRLVEDKSGTVVWGAFGTGQVNPGTPQGARLVALPLQADTGQAAAHGSLRADGALDRYVVRLFGLPMALDAYYQILSALGARVSARPGPSTTVIGILRVFNSPTTGGVISSPTHRLWISSSRPRPNL